MGEKDTEIKEIKEQLNELVALLKQSEARRKEVVKEQRMREQAVAIALATSASVRFSDQHFMVYVVTYIAHCTGAPCSHNKLAQGNLIFFSSLKQQGQHVEHNDVCKIIFYDFCPFIICDNTQ